MVSLSSHCSDRQIYSLFNKLLDVYCNTNIPASIENDRQLIMSNVMDDSKFVKQYVPLVWSNEQQMSDSCHQLLKLFYPNPSNSATNGTKSYAILDECLNVRRREIFRSIAHRVIISQAEYLHNYDWTVSVVLATDRSNRVEQPLLKLNLLIHRPEMDPIPLAYEFTKTELSAFIDMLRDAKKAWIQAMSE